MLRFVADENVPGSLVRGLRRREPALDMVRVQDVGMAGKSDASLLAWAAKERRVVVTCDRATLPAFAYDRVRQGHEMSGVIVLRNSTAIADAIEELLVMNGCTAQIEWQDVVIYLPL